jgi:hypothetical protein
MDRGELESIVVPAWLSPPAFFAIMVLVGAMSLGLLGLEWYVERQMETILAVLCCTHGVQVLGVLFGPFS